MAARRGSGEKGPRAEPSLIRNNTTEIQSMFTRFLKALPLGVLVAIGGFAISFLQFVHGFEEDVGLGLLFKLRGA